MPTLKEQARILRITRRVHRLTGIYLFALMVVVALTGIALGWKKHIDLVQPPSQRGSTTDMEKWLPIDSLHQLARKALQSRWGRSKGSTIARMDVRPAKGIVKVTFEGHYYGVQLDAATGAVLSMEPRHADWIEAVHDGSILDTALETDIFKLLISTLSGCALLVFSGTGFWLWYAPTRMRRKRHKMKKRRKRQM